MHVAYFPLFYAYPVLFPLKDSEDSNIKTIAKQKKKTLLNIDTKNSYLNGACENGAISVYDEEGYSSWEVIVRGNPV